MKILTAFTTFWLFAALLPAQSTAQWLTTNGPVGGYVFQMTRHSNNTPTNIGRAFSDLAFKRGQSRLNIRRCV